MASGDLEGIVITGLTPSGLFLIQNYVDRTGDVQTAALAASFVHHSLKAPAASLAARWIESYRVLLDSWHLYTTRAKLDIARGRRLTAAVDNGLVEADAVARFAPPTMLVRCNFCDTVVTPQPFGGVAGGGQGGAAGLAGVPAGAGGPTGTPVMASAVSKRGTLPPPSSKTKVRPSPIIYEEFTD
jgi:hypothetical protein